MVLEAVDHLTSRGISSGSPRSFTSYSGIKMPPTKKSMVEGRLRRRVRAVGVDSLNAYCRYLFEQDGLQAEAVSLIDAVTTNKTDFFREPDHFRYMIDQAIPGLLAAQRGNAARRSRCGARPARSARSPTRWRWCWPT